VCATAPCPPSTPSSRAAGSSCAAPSVNRHAAAALHDLAPGSCLPATSQPFPPSPALPSLCRDFVNPMLPYLSGHGLGGSSTEQTMSNVLLIMVGSAHLTGSQPPLLPLPSTCASHGACAASGQRTLLQRCWRAGHSPACCRQAKGCGVR
jgi:hypothetical protein